MPKITLNNKMIEFVEPCSLQVMLEKNEHLNTYAAVAVNRKFIPRQWYETTILQDGDCVDVVEPMVGG